MSSIGKIILAAMLLPLVCGIGFMMLFVMLAGLAVPQLPAWAQGGVQDWLLDFPQDSDFYPSEFGEISAGYSAVGWSGYADEQAGGLRGIPIGGYPGLPPVGCNFGFEANYTRNGQPVPHVGVDWTVSEGHPVVSVLQGQVVYAGLNDGWGRLVVIENGGIQLWLAHLLEIDVSPGQIVPQGAPVGLSGGRTPPAGNSTGAHLHEGVRVLQGDTARWIDPLQFVGAGEWLDTPCR
jgi:murein DD-endopeptidase MepM/ murein hydrolase activator NlpD